jgi:hypothetical protein
VDMSLPVVGAACFGGVVGWMANHVLERAKEVNTKWLGSMISILGGGAVTALFEPRSQLFGAYCVGLAGAFFIRVIFLPVIRWCSQFFADEAARELEKRHAKRSHPAAKDGIATDPPEKNRAVD